MTREDEPLWQSLASGEKGWEDFSSKELIESLILGPWPLLLVLTRVYWVMGMMLYSIKFLSPSFNEFTTYGKLQGTSSRKWGMLPHRVAWNAFYLFACSWTFFVVLIVLSLVCFSLLLFSSRPSIFFVLSSHLLIPFFPSFVSPLFSTFSMAEMRDIFSAFSVFLSLDYDV